MVRKILIVIISILISSCSLVKEEGFIFKKRDKPLVVKYPSSPNLVKLAIKRQIDYFNKRLNIDSIKYGNLKIDKGRAIESLELLDSLLESNFITIDLNKYFDVYTLDDLYGKTEVTSYYSPIYSGDYEKSDRYKWALYKKPENLFYINTEKFDPNFLKRGRVRSASKVACLVDFESKRVDPVFSRNGIDFQGKLSGKGLELIYFDSYPDIFSFHIQGGGFVETPDGKIHKFNYAGKNSRSYKSLGKYMIEKGLISRDSISMQTIKRYLNKNPETIEEICSVNESYVFYEKDFKVYNEISNSMAPKGSLGFPVTPETSIAMDKKHFSGGGLFFLDCSDSYGGEDYTVKNFVIDQDTGGAIIKNHIDFYKGIGRRAGDFSGKFRAKNGKLYLLLKP